MPNRIGTKSELKEDNPGWKATKGGGKSIYDCENEAWAETSGEKLSRSYKKVVSDEDIEPEWVEINLRED